MEEIALTGQGRTEQMLGQMAWGQPVGPRDQHRQPLQIILSVLHCTKRPNCCFKMFKTKVRIPLLWSIRGSPLDICSTLGQVSSPALRSCDQLTTPPVCRNAAAS